MPLVIRPYDPSDLPRLQAVRRAAFAPVFASFRAIVGEHVYAHALQDAEREQEALLTALCADGSRAAILVAVLDGEIVGFVSYTVNDRRTAGEIGLNAVHPTHAGAGIGTRLYERALEDMRARGLAVATVSTGADPSHAPARRAYAKVGFGSPIPSVTLYRRL